MVIKNSLQGKIREFDKLMKIRELKINICHTGYIRGYIHVTMSNTLEQTEGSGTVPALLSLASLYLSLPIVIRFHL